MSLCHFDAVILNWGLNPNDCETTVSLCHFDFQVPVYEYKNKGKNTGMSTEKCSGVQVLTQVSK